MTGSPTFDGRVPMADVRRVIFLAVLAMGGCATPPMQPGVPTIGVVAPKDQNLGLACRLLKASRCAYAIAPTGELNGADAANYPWCSLDALERVTFASGFENINAVLAELAPDAVIIAYRGTLAPGNGRPAPSVLADWRLDLDAELVRSDDLPGKIHQGFLNGVLDTFPAMLTVLDDWRASGKLAGKKLYVTGHSKGGAMAVVGTALLARQQFEPTAIYTFAAPRAGDTGFASDYVQKGHVTWRYENRYDVVPHVPPNANEGALVTQVFSGAFRDGSDKYQAVGEIVYINWDGQLTAAYPGLDAIRLIRFKQEFDRSPATFPETIVRAHSSGRGFGYGQAICGEPPDPSYLAQGARLEN
jgi:hypothetical protein